MPAADVDGRAVVEVLRLDGEDILFSVRGLSPGLLDDKGHGLEFEDQSEFSLRGILERGIGENAAFFYEDLIEVRHEPAAVAEFVAFLFQVLHVFQMTLGPLSPQSSEAVNGALFFELDAVL